MMFGTETNFDVTPSARYLRQQQTLKRIQKFMSNDFYQSHHRMIEAGIHPNRITSIDWSLSGARIATGSTDNVVSITTLADEKLSKDISLKDHTDAVEQVLWHPSQTQELVSIGIDRKLNLWDIRKSTPTTVSMSSQLHNCDWNQDGDVLAIIDRADVLSFYDRKKNEIVEKVEMNNELTIVKWHPVKKDTVLIGCLSGEIYEYKYGSEGKPVQAIKISSVTQIKFDPSQRFMLVGDSAGSINFYNPTNFAFPFCNPILTDLGSINMMSLSAKGDLIAVTNDDGEVNVFSTICDQPLIAEPYKFVNSNLDDPNRDICMDVAWHPKYHLLAFGLSAKTRRDRGVLRIVGVNVSSV